MNEVDVQAVDQDETTFEIQVTDSDLNHAREVIINELGVNEDDFSTCEVTFIPTGDKVSISEDDKGTLQNLLDAMDEIEDVQAVYHNAEL